MSKLRLEKGWYNKTKDPVCLNCGQLRSKHRKGFIERCPVEYMKVMGFTIADIEKIARG